MNKKNYLRPNLEIVEVSFQPLLAESTSGDGGSAQTGSSGSRSLNSFEDED
jgi:hypothetical protein